MFPTKAGRLLPRERLVGVAVIGQVGQQVSARLYSQKPFKQSPEANHFPLSHPPLFPPQVDRPAPPPPPTPFLPPPGRPSIARARASEGLLVFAIWGMAVRPASAPMEYTSLAYLALLTITGEVRSPKSETGRTDQGEQEGEFLWGWAAREALLPPEMGVCPLFLRVPPNCLVF